MIGHYLLTALSKFRRTPFTALANVLTLALGLACFIAAWGIATWWRSADAYHEKSDRTVVITQTVSGASENAAARFNPASSATLARYVREDVPELDLVARAFETSGAAVAGANSKLLIDASYIDPGFLSIFDFTFISGSRDAFLSEPSGLILTQDTAQRLFGSASALGQSLIIDNDRQGVVTAVIAPVRQPSFMGEHSDAALSFGMLGHWRASPGGVSRDAQDVWLRSNAYTFATLAPGASLSRANEALVSSIARRIPSDVRGDTTVAIEAVPVSQLTLRRIDNDLLGRSGLNLSATTLLFGFGALILLIAAMNYANLATAQAASRSQEIGLRRVLGAHRSSVMLQCWLEAILSALIAVAVALLVVALIAPVIRAQTSVDMTMFLSHGFAPFAMLAGLAILAGLVAGAYPALVLSGVRPVAALRPGGSGLGPNVIARILVSVQFASASFLLILVIVTQLQRYHLEQSSLDLSGDPMVVLNNLSSLDIDETALIARLEALPAVRSATMTDRLPWSEGRAVVGFSRSADAAAIPIPGHLKIVRHGYFETFGLDPLAGRVFSPERETAPTPLAQTESIVVDEAFAQRLGFASPQAAAGQIVHGGPDRQAFRIIGVTATEATRLEASDVSGHVYAFSQWRSGSSHLPILRIDSRDVPGAVAAITQVWDEFAPNAPANIQFFDALFERSFTGYARTGQTFMLLAASAFGISSIGIFGIAVHVASRRRREVAIRKTLGSSSQRVVRMLLADFSRPVLVGNLLAWPLAWAAGEAYLRSFADRVDLSPAPFGASMAITLLIAWAAVIGVVFKAATARPAEVLRRA